MIQRESNLHLRKRRFCALACGVFLLVFAVPGQAQWKSLDTYRKDFLNIGSYSYITAITSSDYYAYFGSSSGILRYDILNREFIEPLSISADGLVGNTISRIVASFDDEKLWVETDFGVFLYERVFGYWTQTSGFPNGINSGSYVAPEPIHNPPFGYTYFPDGVIMSDAGRQFITEPIYQDKAGYLWMGIQGFGPARSEVNNGDLEFLPFGLLGDDITSIRAIDDNLVIGGYLGASARVGLTQLNLTTGAFDYIEQGIYRNFPEVNVTSLGESNRAILVGTASGLYEISKKDNTPLARYDRFNGLPNTQVNASLGFGDTILVATQLGLGMLYADTTGAVSLRKNVLPASHVYCLEPAYPAGRRKLPKSSQVRPRYIWVGAEKGAYRLNVKTLKLKKLNDPEMILQSPVWKIRLRGSELWLLAQDGLVKIDVQTGEAESFLEVSRFTDHTSFDVNEELIAIGTKSGLEIIPYRKRDSKGKKSLSVRFSANDGLPSNYITSVEFAGDFLWIGTDRGLSRFWWNNPSRVY